ncbi:MAG: DUF4268 domain-containing protein [Bacteroidales bacterium]|nr:DUF4268 domain-containing protein [Bacteroidales bacterium]
MLDCLFARKATIEQEYGRSLVRERLPDKKSSRIKDERSFRTFEMDDESEVFAFMNEAGKRMYTLFRKCVIGMP